MPWLPDIHSRGVALLGAPGAGIHKIEFGYADDSSDWENIQGVQIRLREGSGGPAPLPELRGTLFELGKGDVAEVELSSCLAAAHLEDLQLWRWFVQATAGNPKYKKSAADPYGYYIDWATSGLAPLLTPKRKLRLICAVRQPLTVPARISGWAAEEPGANHITLGWKLAVSRKSTVSLDVRTAWTEPVDVFDGTTWTTQLRAKSADLGEVLVPAVDAANPEGELDLSKLDNFGVRADFHDTKAHWVTFTTRAKSRFAEYFTETGDRRADPHGIDSRRSQ